MATIKPFKGIRPPQNLVEKVASRPYDVLNSEEARAEAEGNEMSLYHIIKPEIDFLSVQMNMILVFIKRQPRTSGNFRTKDGWCRMRRKTITFMPRL